MPAVHILATFVVSIVVSIALSSQSAAQSCDGLFKPESSNPFIHSSWNLFLEQDYDKWLKWSGAVGDPVANFGVGKLIYQHWQQGVDSDLQLLKVGFRIIEPSATNPTEVARFIFPESFALLAGAIERAQGPKPYFKLATYGDSRWLKLDQPLKFGIRVAPESDLSFRAYAEVVAAGYATLWPTDKNLGLLHDLAHVTEYLEFPPVFPALQTFFGRYLSEGWDATPYYRQRAESFNEFSYILRESRYSSIDFILVSSLTGEVPVAERAAVIRTDFNRDPEYAVAMTKRLTESFNEIFDRHGGGARDFFNVENYFLTQQIIETYVQRMKADPTQSQFRHALEPKARIEAIESLEGLQRQIIYTLGEFEKKPDTLTVNYLAYRIAQLETAIVAQRALSLRQVDIITDSMQPIGLDTKTRRYFKSFQPPGSYHYNAFVNSF